jgi:hypothetical protein
MKEKESYKEFLARTYREMTEQVDAVISKDAKKGLDETNPLLLRIQTLEKKVRELEKKN